MSPPNTSRILDDIMSLEQDFKYNLDLLKVRDLEIERCKAVNENLQSKLNKLLNDHKDLNRKYNQLLDEFDNLKRERIKDKEAFEIKSRLVEKEKYENNKKFQDMFGKKFDQKNDLLSLLSEMKISEHKYKQTILSYERQINEQTERIESLQRKHADLVEENVMLSNKIKEINARNIAEICMYKSELEKSSSEISCLKKEVGSVQSDYKAYLSSQNRLVKENNELQMKIVTLTKKYQDCSSENKQIHDELRTLKIKYDTLKQSHELLEKQGEMLTNQQNETESLIQQNKIMQEIIKTLRKNRETI